MSAKTAKLTLVAFVLGVPIGIVSALSDDMGRIAEPITTAAAVFAVFCLGLLLVNAISQQPWKDRAEATKGYRFCE